jgi:hypothetical protein
LDCQQVAELIDAYVLGAVTGDEAQAMEEHVAECIGCWELLRDAQQTADLLPLTAPLHQTPVAVRDRLMAEAAKDTPEARKRRSISEMVGNLHINWPAVTGVFGTATAAVLVFAFSLQMQVDDLEDDNSATQAQLASTTSNIADVLRVATADDAEAHEMAATAPVPAADEEPEGEYRWSRTEGMGVIFCRDLPDLPDDQTYQAWYDTSDDPVSAGTFESHDGNCFHLMQSVVLVSQATGVGVTREKEGGSSKPSGRWLIFTDLED